MKIITILGTRPEIIRLSRIIPLLDKYSEHILVHTGQNFDQTLSDIFFKDLKVRKPDYYLGVKGNSTGEQISKIFLGCEEVFLKEKPDRILILGDTNSGLSSIIAKRMGIKIFHMEAGNRCYDERVPEEINRRVIDHSSDILMPYTEQSRRNLIAEGISGNRIFTIGNPIFEVCSYYNKDIEKSKIIEELNFQSKNFILVTLHRAENVDLEKRLKNIFNALEQIAKKFKKHLIVSLHPHTRNNLKRWNIVFDESNISLHNPFGFFDFLKLEKNAWCVITDSGTVQEECSIFKIPNITIRDVTERPETIECGSNIITGIHINNLLSGIDAATSLTITWIPPVEYQVDNVSSKVLKILIGV